MSLGYSWLLLSNDNGGFSCRLDYALKIMPQTEQHNNQWHSDHFIFFLSFFWEWRRDHLFLRTKLKAAVFWIIHFSNCNTLLETFGLALKAYLMRWSRASFPYSQGKIVMDPQRNEYGSYLYCSASLFLLTWVFPPLNNKKKSAYGLILSFPPTIMCNGSDWHRDCPLPYHMGDCILHTGSFFC